MSRGFKYFIFIWIGQLISSIGSGMSAFALAVYVFQIEQSATSVSLVTLFAFLPTVLLSPVSGVLADKYDRRLLMIIGDGLSALGLIFILICYIQNNLSLFIILMGLLFSSVWSSLLDPAYKATVSDLLESDEYSKASGLIQLSGAAKYLISPLLAGLFLVKFDLSFILMIDICTIVVTVIIVVIVRKSFSKKLTYNKNNDSIIKLFREGWEVLKHRQAILLLIVILSITTFFIGTIQTLYTPFLLSLTSVLNLGIVQSVSAISLLIVSIYLGIKPIKSKLVKIISVSLCLMGGTIVILGTLSNIVIITITSFLIFATIPFINVSVEVLIRNNVENQIQGRVWGVISLLSQLGYLFAYLLAGPLADYIFTPLLIEGGALANSVGSIIGTGEGRGVGLMFIIVGTCIIIIGLKVFRSNQLRNLEVIK